MFEFSTRQYVFSHGKNPKGYGSWAFSVQELDGGKQIFWAPTSTYGLAKTWIKNHVRPLIPADYAGTVTINVLP